MHLHFSLFAAFCNNLKLNSHHQISIIVQYCVVYLFLLFFLCCHRDPSDPDAVLIKRVLGVAGDYVKYVDYFQHSELSFCADAPQPSYGGSIVFIRQNMKGRGG